MIKQISLGQMSPDKKDCSFLWLYCLDGQPYQKYRAETAPPVMPMVFVLMRWDGMLGTMGGKVDAGENLLQALRREVAEEAGFFLAADVALEPLGTFQDHDWHIHSFAHEVSFEALLNLRESASKAERASPECAGWAVIPTEDYQPNIAGARGVAAFKQNRFVSTAGLEFNALLALIDRKKSFQQVEW